MLKRHYMLPIRGPGGQGTKVHFPGLDGIRFVAAFSVLVHHLEQFKNTCGLPSYYHTSLIGRLGADGVRLFFVLSGYQITYLLLQEARDTGGIHVRLFYFRRFLRIWPLYYLIVVLAFFVLNPLISFAGTQR